jgi:hypothetical protein
MRRSTLHSLYFLGTNFLIFGKGENMATETESQAKVWTKPAATITLIEDGDITAKLKEIKAMYLKKAEELENKAIGDKMAEIYKAVAFYYRAADAVDILIEQGSKH